MSAIGMWLRWALAALVGLLGILVLAGFLGHLHPIGDSLAVFRVPLASLLLVIWAVWGRTLRWAVPAVCIFIVFFHGYKSNFYSEGDAPDGAIKLRLYQQNLLLNRTETDRWLAHIAALSPDILTLQELSDANRPLLARLRDSYPYQQFCPVGRYVGEAVLSRYPLVKGSGFCTRPDGLAGVQIVSPAGPLWVISLHVAWPWPKGQASQITGLLPYLERLEGPVVVAGDFNAVAWSHSLARVRAASGTTRIGPWGKSFDLPGIHMPLGIDHVLATQTAGARVQVQPKLGSDHNGLLAELFLK